MSGWTKTSKIGPAASAIAASGTRNSFRRFGRGRRRKAARKSASSTLPNSEGWKVKKPMSIQRREPRVAAPATSTSAITPVRPR